MWSISYAKVYSKSWRTNQHDLGQIIRTLGLIAPSFRGVETRVALVNPPPTGGEYRPSVVFSQRQTMLRFLLPLFLPLFRNDIHFHFPTQLSCWLCTVVRRGTGSSVVLFLYVETRVVRDVGCWAGYRQLILISRLTISETPKYTLLKSSTIYVF